MILLQINHTATTLPRKIREHPIHVDNINTIRYRIEPAHDKTYIMACAPGEDSDQPGHPPCLIRVFAVHMKKAWVLSYPLSAQRRLI